MGDGFREIAERQMQESLACAIDSAFSDIGPTAPSRVAVYRKAHELRELARRAEEFTTAGPSLNLTLAEQQFRKMAKLLGTAE
ncbi:hypothetical protein DXH95_03005 [Sphingorhabdus pulchriflava]|uniref:Uncharacterized protein n=1 Tax=Sphingorhabdus pulchriflava TaxID=2292257 RepID=A0A371BFR0_9SPHN|nr:hypothetical protein [Sphingorhabdus pulchriflava]RDV06410.1 hypothetical protein DXH95_03005 [Sphingorhabdus pulchriflava]